MKHKEYIIPIGEEAKEFDEMFIGVIRKQPELIRCKDCIYNSCSPNGGNACCEKFYGMTDPNGYCYYGERRYVR